MFKEFSSLFKSVSKRIRRVSTFLTSHKQYVFAGLMLVALFILAAITVVWQSQQLKASSTQLVAKASESQSQSERIQNLSKNLEDLEASLAGLLSRDEYQINTTQQEELNQIRLTYQKVVETYEDLLALNLSLRDGQPFYTKLTSALLDLSNQNYSSASATLTALTAEIVKAQQVAAPIPASVPTIQEAPSTGYRRQAVTTEFGTYQVDVLAADLSNTRVVVETASDQSCTDNCPVASLAEYVSRAGGFAGINGPYFCPAEYPSCAGKTNSFDTLLMNSKKTYFNSDNNVYSTVPAVIFGDNWVRFVGQSLEWGRDTGVDAVIAAQPMLLSGGEVRFGGDGDPKKGSRGSRSFIGAKGNTLYIGVVRSATVAEVAHVLKVMGLEHALNLDSGGSTAFMAGGRYVAGPGRNTPFGIVLVKK